MNNTFIGSYTLEIEERKILPTLQQSFEINELNELKEVLIYTASNHKLKTQHLQQLKIDELKSSINGNVLRIVGLVNLNLIPFWLIYKFTDILIYTSNEQTESVFNSLVGISNFNENAVFGILIDCGNSKDDGLLMIYPSLVNNAVQFKILKLEFNNEINSRLEKIHKLWAHKKLKNKPTTTYFVEIELEKKKEDSFLDAYLKKRQAGNNIKIPSLSRQNSSPVPQSVPPPPLTTQSRFKTSTTKLEEFHQILEKCIHNEFRMRGLNSKLSKDDLSELYSIIYKSIKFILRNPKGNKFPTIEKINSVLMNLFDMLLNDVDGGEK